MNENNLNNESELSSCKPKSEKQTENREVYVMMIAGKKKTGKTTILKNILAAALKEGRRALIVTPNEVEWRNIPLVNPRFPERVRSYKGARRIICHGEKEIIQNITTNFKNGLLIMDDFRTYVRDKLPEEIKTLMIGCRHQDVDFFAVAHGFTEIPVKAFPYATHFMIFATTDNVVQRKRNVVDYDAFQAAVDRVNYNARLNPHYYEIIKNE